MAYNDEEKRAFCIGYMIEFLNTLDTWEKCQNFIRGVSPETMKARLKKAYQGAQIEDDTNIASVQEKKVNDTEMVDEIDNI